MFVLIVVFYLLCFSFFYLLWSMFLAGSRPKFDPKLVAQSRPISRPQTLTWSSSHELCMAFFLHELQLAHLPAMHCSLACQKFHCMSLAWLDLEHPRAENPAYTGPVLHARQEPTTSPASTCTAATYVQCVCSPRELLSAPFPSILACVCCPSSLTQAMVPHAIVHCLVL